MDYSGPTTYFPSLSRDHGDNLSTDLFKQDIKFDVMPSGGITDIRNNFTVTLKGDQRECERVRQLIAGNRTYGRYDPTFDFIRAVEEVVQNLVREGSAPHEVICDENGLHHITSFTSNRLWRLPGCYLQVIPRGDWEFWNRKFTIVPADRIWQINMPSALGGRRGYKRILRRLGKCKDISHKSIQQDLIEHEDKRRYFEFQRYLRIFDIYRSKLTSTWGWDRRDSSLKRETEFYSCYRMVNSYWSKAILREHVIREFNRLFIR